jgi:hypothetical protein
MSSLLDGIDAVVDLLGRLPEQEQAAGDQDHVLPREGVVHDREDRRGQADDPGDHRQQGQAHHQRQRDADAADPLPVLGRQLVRQDRDEDQIVDPQHDFHDDEGDKGGPGGWIGQECGDFGHGSGIRQAAAPRQNFPPWRRARQGAALEQPSGPGCRARLARNELHFILIR